MAIPSSKKERYGLLFEKYLDELEVEMHMYRKGGQWTGKYGQTVGNGLFFHFKKIVQILWPHIVWHKWIDLIVGKYIEHRSIAILGPASSGKTISCAVCVLTDYLIFPECTTVLVCSTTKELLENRIWGDVKTLHRLAKQERPWLAGNLIEGRLRIVTSNKDEVTEGRDFKNGLLGVPCFPSGTLVDTPSGQRPIEDIRIGDVIFNSCGQGTVTETHLRKARRLVRVRLRDGRTFDCTPEHPVFTQKGWLKAADLKTCDMVFSVYETMRLLRPPTRKGLSQSKVLLPALPVEVEQEDKMQLLRTKVSPLEAKAANAEARGKVLHPSLHESVGRATPGILQKQDGEMRALWKTNEKGSFYEEVLFCKMSQPPKTDSMPAVRQSLYLNSRVASQAEVTFLRQILQEERSPSGLPAETCESDRRRNDGLERIPGIHCSLPCSHRPEKNQQQCPLVSTRFGISKHKTGRGNRRWSSSNSGKGRERHQTHQDIGGTWVDSVEILEPRSDARFNEGEGGYTVHNLEVSGHPSYSVNGVVVHNCKRGNEFVNISDFAGVKNKRVRVAADELSLLPPNIIHAFSNLDKNPDFKLLGPGNPKDTTDALGVMAEPAPHLGGWDGGLDQAAGTKTWETRRSGGIAIQLDGLDSPNLDGNLGCDLITQAAIDRDISFYGTDSLWFTMMDRGMMPRGIGSRRVLTRQMAKQFGAMEEPNWLNGNRVKIGFLDAAYGGIGGDRCIFGELQFGDETTPVAGQELVTAIVNQSPLNPRRRQIIALIATLLVPVSVKLAELPCDQIVAFVRAQCESRGIVPENFFFDAGMRTALVQAFSRLWSTNVQSIDCGGAASDRQVSADIDVAAKDYYFNKITEIWYSVRNTVEARQWRGMTESVLQEFCQREWGPVGKNKIQVEPKEAMKKKMGRSPDEADAVAVGLEGAVQRGFIIQRLKSERQSMRDDRWKLDLQRKASQLWRSKELNHAA